jgi:hypothetical protein
MQRSIILIAAILTAALLAGCRQEQDHPLVMGNGTYTGKTYSKLSQRQLSELESRAALQGTANVSGGAARRPTEERPAPPQSQALEKRLQEQVGK